MRISHFVLSFTTKWCGFKIPWLKGPMRLVELFGEKFVMTAWKHLPSARAPAFDHCVALIYGYVTPHEFVDRWLILFSQIQRNGKQNGARIKKECRLFQIISTKHRIFVWMDHRKRKTDVRLHFERWYVFIYFLNKLISTLKLHSLIDSMKINHLEFAFMYTCN